MSNPALKENVIEKYVQTGENFEVATASGTALKTALLLAILVTAASFTYSLVFKNFIDKAYLLGTVGLFGAFIVSMVIIFSRNIKWTAPLSLLYSGLEGLAIGGISALFAVKYGAGLVLSAVLATFGALLAMLFLYSARIIRCTEKFRSTILVAMFGILIIYLVDLVMSFFNPNAMSLLMGNGAVGLGFSAFVCVIAALNFIIDFDMIEKFKEMGASKDFEWYGAFSLMVTIVWLYIEILKLLAKANSRR